MRLFPNPNDISLLKWMTQVREEGKEKGHPVPAVGH